MKSVVLSTTEAEYVAVSEVVKDIKFLYQMLRSMEAKVSTTYQGSCGQCWHNLAGKQQQCVREDKER